MASVVVELFLLTKALLTVTYLSTHTYLQCNMHGPTSAQQAILMYNMCHDPRRHPGWVSPPLGYRDRRERNPADGAAAATAAADGDAAPPSAIPSSVRRAAVVVRPPGGCSTTTAAPADGQWDCQSDARIGRGGGGGWTANNIIEVDKSI